ncbi:mCG144651, partial [Mus musculus]
IENALALGNIPDQRQSRRPLLTTCQLSSGPLCLLTRCCTSELRNTFPGKQQQPLMLSSLGAREMDQWSTALSALPEVYGWIPSTHMEAHKI